MLSTDSRWAEGTEAGSAGGATHESHKAPRGQAGLAVGVWGTATALWLRVGQNSSKGSGQFSYEQGLHRASLLTVASEPLASTALSDYSATTHPSGNRGHQGLLR